MIGLENKIASIMPLAIIIEATITYINQFFVSGEFCWEMLLSIVLGILISIAYEIDIPKYLNLHSRIPYLRYNHIQLQRLWKPDHCLPAGTGSD